MTLYDYKFSRTPVFDLDRCCTGTSYTRSSWNNSIFPFGTLYNNYCDDNYFETAAWLSVGTTLFEGLGTALAGLIQNKVENSVPNLERQVEAYNEQIDTELETLGLDDTSNFEIESSYQEDVNKAEEDIETAQARISSLNTTIASLKAEVDALNPEADDYTTKKAELDAQIKEKEKLEASIKEGGDLYNKKAEAEEARKARQAEIDEAKEKIAELTKARDEIQNIIDAKIVDKADGNKLTRNKEFKPEVVTEGYSEFKQGDIKELVFQFTQAEDGSEHKLNYAKALVNLDEATFNNFYM